MHHGPSENTVFGRLFLYIIHNIAFGAVETGLEPSSLIAKPLAITAFSNLRVSFWRFSCLLFLRAESIALTDGNRFARN